MCISKWVFFFVAEERKVHSRDAFTYADLFSKVGASFLSWHQMPRHNEAQKHRRKRHALFPDLFFLAFINNQGFKFAWGCCESSTVCSIVDNRIWFQKSVLPSSTPGATTKMTPTLTASSMTLAKTTLPKSPTLSRSSLSRSSLPRSPALPKSITRPRHSDFWHSRPRVTVNKVSSTFVH